MQKIRCKDWINSEKAIWIISQEYNALLHVEKDTKAVRTEAFIEEYPLYKSGWYYSGVLSGDYIVCIPSAAKDIIVYSLSDRNMFYIPIEISGRACGKLYNPAFSFFRGYAYGDNVLILGASYPALMNLNLKTQKLHYLCDWTVDTETYISQEDTGFYFGDGYVRLKGELFIPMTCCGAFLDVELETLECKLVFPPDKMDSIEGVTQIGDRLCFVGKKETSYYLCLWHPDKEEIRTLRIPYQGKSFMWISFLSPIFWKSRVYLTPQTADHFYVADLESEEISVEENLDRMISEFPEELRDVKVGALKQDGNTVVFHTWWDYKWHRYNLDTWEYEDFQLQFDDEDYIQYSRKVLCSKLQNKEYTIFENEGLLPIFLDVIKNTELSCDKLESVSRINEQKWKRFLKTEYF